MTIIMKTATDKEVQIKAKQVIEKWKKDTEEEKKIGDASPEKEHKSEETKISQPLLTSMPSGCEDSEAAPTEVSS